MGGLLWVLLPVDLIIATAIAYLFQNEQYGWGVLGCGILGLFNFLIVIRRGFRLEGKMTGFSLTVQEQGARGLADALAERDMLSGLGLSHEELLERFGSVDTPQEMAHLAAAEMYRFLILLMAKERGLPSVEKKRLFSEEGLAADMKILFRAD